MRRAAERLPAGLDWAILFNLHTFGMLIDGAELRQVFRLAQDCPLERHSHVVLSSQGRLLAPRDGGPLEDAVAGLPWTLKGAGSLVDSFQERLQAVAWEDADCLGLARLDSASSHPGVVLSVVVDPRTGWGSGTAVWDRDEEDLDGLLAAVGVHPDGGERSHAGRVSRLRIHVPTHIQAGRLASFTRPDNCTWFFLRQGQLDEQLQRGLALAGRDRVREGGERALAATARLARSATTDGWAMRFEPVHPAPARHYGNVAPHGLVLRTLRHAGDGELHGELLANLEREQREGLWPFHRGGLPTATDTGLMALGLAPAAATTQALESFRTKAGGYVPQHWAASPQPGRMMIRDACRHWCQADYATTALVAALRREGEDPRSEALDFLAAGFDRRGGLFFANPYLVDWALAEAVGRTGPEHLRSALLAELLASINDDHSFGRYDIACSTALGALALAALGYRGKTLRLVQLRLVDLLTPEGATPVNSVLFHQSLRLDPERLGPARLTRLALDDSQRRIVSVGNSWFALAWFRDSAGLLATSLAALALAVPCESAIDDLEIPQPVADNRLGRYRAASPSEYIAEFALPPYAD